MLPPAAACPSRELWPQTACTVASHVCVAAAVRHATTQTAASAAALFRRALARTPPVAAARLVAAASIRLADRSAAVQCASYDAHTAALRACPKPSHATRHRMVTFSHAHHVTPSSQDCMSHDTLSRVLPSLDALSRAFLPSQPLDSSRPSLPSSSTMLCYSPLPSSHSYTPLRVPSPAAAAFLCGARRRGHPRCHQPAVFATCWCSDPRSGSLCCYRLAALLQHLRSFFAFEWRCCSLPSRRR